MKKILFTLILLISFFGYSQETALKTDLLNLKAATTAEMNAFTRMEEGSMCYNNETETNFQYRSGVWVDLGVSGGGSATTDASDLTSGVLADARVPESNVTQHEEALNITESQISDLTHTTDTNLSNSEVETAYNNQVAVVSQVDAEAGTSTIVKRWTPQRVSQAISALWSGSGYLLLDGTLPMEGTLNMNNNSINNALYIDIDGYITMSNEIRMIPDDVIGTMGGRNNFGFKTGNIGYFGKLGSGIELGFNYDALTADRNITFPDKPLDFGDLSGEIDDEIGTSWRTGGSATNTYEGVLVGATNSTSLDYNVSTNRKINMNIAASTHVVNFINKGGGDGEPIVFHAKSAEAGGTTITFDSETYDNKGTAGFSVSLAENEEITLNFIITSSSQVRATNYPLGGSAGSGDLWSDHVDSDIIPDGDGTRDLGSASNEFFRIYTENIVVSNSISGDGSAISSLTGGNVNLVDAGGYFTNDTVELALQELGASSGTDDQNLSITGNTINIENGTGVDVSTITAVADNTAKVTNTDSQTINQLSVSGDFLGISLSNDGEVLQTVNLSSIAGISGDASGYGDAAYKDADKITFWDPTENSTPPTLGANEYSFQINLTPVKVVTTATFKLDEKVVYNDVSADATTITFSDLEAAVEFYIYVDRASAPTLSGATFEEMPDTKGFLSNTPMILYGIVHPNKTRIDYSYTEIN